MFIWCSSSSSSCFKRPARHPIHDPAPRSPTLHDGIAKIHHRHDDDCPAETTTLYSPVKFPHSKRKSGNYHVFKRGPSVRPLFNWADHPSLVTDAFENGWSIFGFTSPPQLSPSSVVRSSSMKALLGQLCNGDRGEEVVLAVAEPEICWEVSQSSADFMQKIRLNPGGAKRNNVPSVIRTALPLPGPQLGNTANSAFPQEAYFEITISYSGGEDRYQNGRRSSSAGKGEKIRLIQQVITANNSNSISYQSGSVQSKMEELELSAGKDEKKKTELLISSVAIGLSVGSGCSPFKLPGSYQGSIGFNSNGSVYLDGMKLGFESKASDNWGKATERVIGCGFDPRQKKVIFTVDSELVHTIECKSEEFGTPLYPTIAANSSEVVVVVNLGQSAFSYAPANEHRTPNPCFIGPVAVKSGAGNKLGYDEEDSKELFSMGKIDSQWLNRSATKYPHLTNISGSGNFKNVVEKEEEEEAQESEAELFEIVLDTITV
ncbi:hypothetical protein LINPERPRIM_LOCUS32916 [Linum perenne]